MCEPHLTRRRLLEASGVAVVGAGAFASTAAAHECPRTPGYWANHPWPSTVSDPFTLAGVTKSVGDWQAFLVAPTRGDKGAIMAKHLLATVLNFQYRPKSDPECVDAPIGVDGTTTTVRSVKRAAQEWLEASAFDGPVRSWDVPPVGDGEHLKDVLDAFNDGTLGLSCDCTGESDGTESSTEDDGKGDDPPGRGPQSRSVPVPTPGFGLRWI